MDVMNFGFSSLGGEEKTTLGCVIGFGSNTLPENS